MKIQTNLIVWYHLMIASLPHSNYFGSQSNAVKFTLCKARLNSQASSRMMWSHWPVNDGHVKLYFRLDYLKNYLESLVACNFLITHLWLNGSLFTTFWRSLFVVRLLRSPIEDAKAPSSNFVFRIFLESAVLSKVLSLSQTLGVEYYQRRH